MNACRSEAWALPTRNVGGWHAQAAGAGMFGCPMALAVGNMHRRSGLGSRKWRPPGRLLPVALLVGLLAVPAFGQTAGIIGFKGLIKDGVGNPINGTVDLEFRMYDAATLGNVVDMDGDGSVEDPGDDVTTVLALSVTNGVLVTKFGPVHPSAFDGSDRWLEVRVDDGGGGGFVALSRVEMPTAPATSEQVNIPATGTPAINVDAAGNVGIGTTDPIGTLDVSGTGERNLRRDSATAASGVGVLRLHLTTSSVAGVGLGNGLIFNLEDAGGTDVGNVATVSGVWEDPAPASRKGALAFWTSSVAAGDTEKMRITSDRNVGIGRTVPLAKLSVQGSQQESQQALLDLRAANDLGEEKALIVKVTAGGPDPNFVLGTAADGTDARFRLGVNINVVEPALVITSDKVGIRTDTPEMTLDVRGHLVLEAGLNPQLYTGTGGAELNRYLELLNSPSQSSASGLKAGGVLVADVFTFANPGKNELIVKGNVGIGTPSPLTKLDVRGDFAVQSGKVFATETGSGAGYIETRGSGGNINFRVTNLASSSNGGFVGVRGPNGQDNVVLTTLD